MCAVDCFVNKCIYIKEWCRHQRIPSFKRKQVFLELISYIVCGPYDSTVYQIKCILSLALVYGNLVICKQKRIVFIFFLA